MKMAQQIVFTVLILIGLTNAEEVVSNGITKPVIVPIERQVNVVDRPEPVYTLFDMPTFDGDQIYKDVSEKMTNVAEELPSLSLRTTGGTSALSNMYNSLPDVRVPELPDWNLETLTNALDTLGDWFLSMVENVNDSVPDIAPLLRDARDTVNSINFEPVKAAAGDIVAVIPTVMVLAFYGLTFYFILSLLFRAAGFAIATKINTLRLASDAFLQAPEFVSRMMLGNSKEYSDYQNDETARSDEPQSMGLMNLIRGAQKVSEAFDKYNQLNQD